MTKEEAIANLNMISVAFVEPVTKEQRKLIDDTFDMAIKALEQEPCEDATLKEIFCTGCEHKEQQPCPYWDYGLNTCRHANIGALATITPNDVLEKIRAEIREEIIPMTIDGIQVKSSCLGIIDKYKAESEE